MTLDTSTWIAFHGDPALEELAPRKVPDGGSGTDKGPPARQMLEEMNVHVSFPP